MERGQIVRREGVRWRCRHAAPSLRPPRWEGEPRPHQPEQPTAAARRPGASQRRQHDETDEGGSELGRVEVGGWGLEPALGGQAPPKSTSAGLRISAERATWLGLPQADSCHSRK